MTDSVWKLRGEADKRMAEQKAAQWRAERQRLPTKPLVAQSTLDATAWLRRHHPEWLSDWLDRHPELNRKDWECR